MLGISSYHRIELHDDHPTILVGPARGSPRVLADLKDETSTMVNDLMGVGDASGSVEPAIRSGELALSAQRRSKRVCCLWRFGVGWQARASATMGAGHSSARGCAPVGMARMACGGRLVLVAAPAVRFRATRGVAVVQGFPLAG